MTKSRRNAALALAVILFVSIVLCAMFIISESDHCCYGESCAVCRMIGLCTQIIRFVGLPAASCILVFSAAQFSLNSLCANGHFFCKASLVSCKVKLSD